MPRTSVHSGSKWNPQRHLESLRVQWWCCIARTWYGFGVWTRDYWIDDRFIDSAFFGLRWSPIWGLVSVDYIN